MRVSQYESVQCDVKLWRKPLRVSTNTPYAGWIFQFSFNAPLSRLSGRTSITRLLLVCHFSRVIIVRLHASRNEAANPRPSSRQDTRLQLPLLIELDQEVFMILRQSLHSTREPVPLRPEQVCVCPRVLEVSLCVFAVAAKRMTVLITYCVISWSFFTVFQMSSMNSRRWFTKPLVWNSALTDSNSLSNSWFLACNLAFSAQSLASVGCNNCCACNTRLRPLFFLTLTFWDAVGCLIIESISSSTSRLDNERILAKFN